MRTDREKEQMAYARETALLTKRMETASKERIEAAKAGADGEKRPSDFTLDGTRYGWTGDPELGWSPTVIAEETQSPEEKIKDDRELKSLWEKHKDIEEAITKNFTQIDEFGERTYNPTHEALLRIRLNQIEQDITKRETELRGGTAPGISTPVSGAPQNTGLSKPKNVLGLDL
jgi:hypothetical protein